MQMQSAIGALLRGSTGRTLPCLTRMRPALRLARVLLAVISAGICCSVASEVNEMTEYQLKAAYLVNFVSFTEWPAGLGDSLNLCIYGPDPFGIDIDSFEGQNINNRRVEISRLTTAEQLDACNIVFISDEVISNMRRVLDRTENKPVLTVSDSPGAAAAGVSLNMIMDQNRITFEVNLAAINRSNLAISFQLLRLAKKVYK